MIWYCTREQVKAALDVAETARADAQIDRLIAAATERIDGLTNRRRFYPEKATRYVDWPDEQGGYPWRAWLGRNELLAASAVVAGGVTLAPGDYLLRPDDGPPYNRIEIQRAGSAVFSSAGTPQRAIAITGTFGYCDDTEPASTLADTIAADDTTIAITASSRIGVGSLLKIDDEYMRVTGRTMRTTGQTLQTPLTAMTNSTLVAVANGAGFAVGEVILIDAERMLVVDVAGNNLVVRRAWDGSALAAHTAPTIYAARSLAVARGVLGTAANAHLAGATVLRHVVPELVEQLAVAETLIGMGREQSAYARTVGAGDSLRAAPGGDIRDLRSAVRSRYRRHNSGSA